MTILRMVVVAASALQVALGAWIAYRLLYVEVPDLLSAVVCAIVIILGLASAGALSPPGRPSFSRTVTIRTNGFCLGLLMVLAITLGVVEWEQGVATSRLQEIAAMAAMIAVPFLLNSVSLSLIQRRAKRLAAR